MLKRHTVYALLVIAVATAVASFAALKPRPTRFAVTPRAGDDTMVINQSHRTTLSLSVLDQYGRQMRGDTSVRYRRIGGDSIELSSSGRLLCEKHRDAVVRATLGSLTKDFVLRCRPVAWIEAATWLDLVVGDSARDLAFVARGPDGRIVTELRGTITVGSIVAARGTTVRPKRSGETVVNVEIGDARAFIPVVVYQPVKAFGDDGPLARLQAMHVNLGRGDTIEVPLPKAAFWVTYFATDPRAIPPTIELRGQGTCTTGDGIRLRRIADGEYAKYCLTGSGAHLMIAHGGAGAARVNGTVAIRLMW